MSAKDSKWYSDASETELRERAQEMRGEYSTLIEKRRENPESGDQAVNEFRSEIEVLDTQLTLRGMAEMKKAEERHMPEGARSGSTERRSEVLSNPEYAQARTVLENPEFRSWLDGGAKGSSPQVEIRADVAEGSGIGADWLAPTPKYYPTPRQRRLRIRDLMTVIPTTAPNHEYIRELNPTTNQAGASTVAEGGQKPDQTYESEIDTAPVRDIAALTTITRQALQDESTLVAYIQNALVYRIKFREEQQTLTGNGISPDLKGVTLFSGVQTQSTAGAGEYAVTLANAVAKIILADGEPDGIVMNPTTFMKMMSHRVAGGSNAAGGGVFDADAFTSAPVQYVWGLPVVQTAATSANTNHVANWKQLAWIFDREAPSVQVFEQHSDYAGKNKVLLRCEERIALAVPRPDLLCIATTSD